MRSSRRLLVILLIAAFSVGPASARSRWKDQANTGVCGGPPGTPCGWDGITCGSAASCIAEGHACMSTECETGPQEIALAWDGHAWTGSAAPCYPATFARTGVQFCMAVARPADCRGHVRLPLERLALAGEPAGQLSPPAS